MGDMYRSKRSPNLPAFYARRVPATYGSSDRPDPDSQDWSLDDDLSVPAYLLECMELAKWCGGTSHMMGDQATDHILIPGHRGSHVSANPGDWIVKDSLGIFHRIAPGPFNILYEQVGG